jgi:O-antigen ligase
MLGLLGILAILVMINIRTVRKIPKGWFLTGIYIFVSVLFLNFPNSIRYLITFMVGICLIKIELPKQKLSAIPKICSIFGSFFAIMTLLQEFMPTAAYSIIKIFQSNELYQQTVLYKNAYGSCNGVAGEPSFNAFCICIAIMGVLAEVISKKKIEIVKIIWLFAMYYSVFLTNKRSFLLMIPMICVATLLIKGLAEGKKNGIIVCIIFMILMPVVYYAFLDSVIMGILSKGGDSSAINLSNRELFWGIAVDMIKQKPIFGHGMMAYDIFYNDFFNNSHTFAGAHNSYLQLLSEMGIIGGGLYIGCIITTFVKTLSTVWKMQRIDSDYKYPVYFSFFIQFVCIIYGMSGNPFHRPQQLLTYFVAVSIYYHLRKDFIKK